MPKHLKLSDLWKTGVQVEYFYYLIKPTRLSLRGWSPHKQWVSDSSGNEQIKRWLKPTS